MKVDQFLSERILSVWQNVVDFDFTETGVHPMYLNELLTKEEILDLYESVQLRYIQTNGTIPLRDLIAQDYPGSDIDNVLVTNGSAEANFISLWRMIDPGDEIVALYPNYMQVTGIARAFGATVRPVYLNEERSWQPDLNEFESCVTSKTRIIYVTNPNNPTGAILEQKDMREIVNLASRVGAWILSDEVYRGAELKGPQSPSFWGMYDKVLVVAGLSKAFTLPGLRMGWIVGPKDAIKESWGYSDYTTITTGALDDRLARIAMRPETRRKILSRNREISSKNLRILTDWLNSHQDLFRFVPPKIGGVAFVGYDMNINSTDLVMRLIKERSVLIVPGDAFGMDGYVRIGYGSKDLLEGLELVNESLESLTSST